MKRLECDNKEIQDILEDYVLNKLSEEDKKRVDEHLSYCEYCQEEHDITLDMIDMAWLLSYKDWDEIIDEFEDKEKSVDYKDSVPKVTVPHLSYLEGA